MVSSKPQRWSPLTCLGKTNLSPSGLIQLEADVGEVETLVRTNCELRYEGSGPLPKPIVDTTSSSAVDSTTCRYSETWTERDVNLSCHITTHRIVLLDEEEGIGGSIPYPLIQTAEGQGGPSFRSPKASYKIELNTLAWGELLLVFRGGESHSYSTSGKDRDAALNAIHRAMKRKAWEDRQRQAVKEAARPSKTIAARKVGVDAIITKNIDPIDKFEEEDPPEREPFYTKSERRAIVRKRKNEENKIRIKEDLKTWNPHENSKATGDPMKTLFVVCPCGKDNLSSFLSKSFFFL